MTDLFYFITTWVYITSFLWYRVVYLLVLDFQIKITIEICTRRISKKLYFTCKLVFQIKYRLVLLYSNLKRINFLNYAQMLTEINFIHNLAIKMQYHLR